MIHIRIATDTDTHRYDKYNVELLIMIIYAAMIIATNLLLLHSLSLFVSHFYHPEMKYFNAQQTVNDY